LTVILKRDVSCLYQVRGRMIPNTMECLLHILGKEEFQILIAFTACHYFPCQTWMEQWEPIFQCQEIISKLKWMPHTRATVKKVNTVMSSAADFAHWCWLQFDSGLALPDFVKAASSSLYSAAIARSVGHQWTWYTVHLQLHAWSVHTAISPGSTDTWGTWQNINAHIILWYNEFYNCAVHEPPPPKKITHK
jgi:hypothetical protein